MSSDEVAEFLDEARKTKMRLVDVIAGLGDQFDFSEVEAIQAIRDQVVKED